MHVESEFIVVGLLNILNELCLVYVMIVYCRTAIIHVHSSIVETVKVHFDSLVCHLMHVFGCGLTELVCSSIFSCMYLQFTSLLICRIGD